MWEFTIKSEFAGESVLTVRFNTITYRWDGELIKEPNITINIHEDTMLDVLRCAMEIL